MKRYDNTDILRNQEKIFEETFRKRGLPLVRHYETPIMGHPTPQEHREIDSRSHVWRTGDRFFKLAHKYYGDSSLWWIIAAASGIGWGLQCPPGTSFLMQGLVSIDSKLW